MEFRKIQISDLRHASYNPRIDLKPGDPEFEKIKSSISEFGYVEPIIVNSDMTIVGGHQRAKVLKELGFDEIDCVVVEIDKTKEKALNIALNKISGDWDFPALAKLLEDLKEEDYNVELTGFDWSEAEKLWDTYKEVTDDFDGENPDDDFDIVLPEEPISRLGDLWLLGKHRLFCGDSTRQEDVAVLMQEEKAHMVFTDPPWNVNYGADMDHPSWKPRTIMNDSMSTEDFKDFMNGTFKVMNYFSMPGAITYVVMSQQEWGNLMLTMKENDYHWSSTIIWKKDSLVLSRKDYNTIYEGIWYGWLEGAPRLHPVTNTKECDCWEIPRYKVSVYHPTQKPVDLVIRAIKNSSDMKNIVLDLFGGSGTTLIACEETDRHCRMMELDPKYVDVIVKRYIDKVGSDTDAFLVRDGEKIPYSMLVQKQNVA
ncbi:MAG: site-specific DNA-methyltransferase [Eubacteriales bacterium]|nr:site-specific DNA-methyltransferase [Eubacteriales bacterium]